jgi:hypothetical protein
LLQALERQGWQAECWGDQALTARGCRGLFSGCGYEDPRHWADLGGTLQMGCIVVLSRGSNPVHGHVGLDEAQEEPHDARPCPALG